MEPPLFRRHAPAAVPKAARDTEQPVFEIDDCIQQNPAYGNVLYDRLPTAKHGVTYCHTVFCYSQKNRKLQDNRCVAGTQQIKDVCFRIFFGAVHRKMPGKGTVKVALVFSFRLVLFQCNFIRQNIGFHYRIYQSGIRLKQSRNR